MLSDETSAASAQSAALNRTPLHALHAELGARMAPFAGYEMPVQYPLGILERQPAGFDQLPCGGQIGRLPFGTRVIGNRPGVDPAG